MGGSGVATFGSGAIGDAMAPSSARAGHAVHGVDIAPGPMARLAAEAGTPGALCAEQAPVVGPAFDLETAG